MDNITKRDYFNKQDGLKYHFEQRYKGNEHVEVNSDFIM